MDRFLRGYYRQAAENKYLKLRRTEFQAWFGAIMGKAYPDSYQNIRLTQGDGGLDGIDIETGVAYAVYAPRETTQGELQSKINSDFQSARATLEERNVDMKGWVFVHNDEGLTKDVGPALMKLRQDNPNIKIRVWTFDGIWIELKELSDDQLAELFGPGPTEKNVYQLELPQIRDVISHLVRSDPPPLPKISSPDPDKLDFNALDEDNAELMRSSEKKSHLVGTYLSGMTNVSAGEEIAEAFRRKYVTLRETGANADRIFNLIWEFAGGSHFTEPKQAVAVAAVVSYFFNSCDIFENSPTAGEGPT